MSGLFYRLIRDLHLYLGLVTRETGLADARVTLHKSPGQHGPTIRMNWFYIKAWRWLADATVYLILFISVSGIYLWYVLRAGIASCISARDCFCSSSCGCLPSAACFASACAGFSKTVC
jgi:hypothetical protein